MNMVKGMANGLIKEKTQVGLELMIYEAWMTHQFRVFSSSRGSFYALELNLPFQG